MKSPVLRILGLLVGEYGAIVRFLDAEGPYAVLIGVILSAQTTDAQVNGILPALFAAYPTPEALAGARKADVERIIHPVGYFRVKAAYIVGTARKLVENFGGRVPETMEDLLTLPGVGRKSANVVRGSCFGQAAIIVDTHFGRVVRRLGLTTAQDPGKVEREIEAQVPKARRYEFSMLVNRHGREVCHARKPNCGACCLRKLCPSVGSAV